MRDIEHASGSVSRGGYRAFGPTQSPVQGESTPGAGAESHKFGGAWTPAPVHGAHLPEVIVTVPHPRTPRCFSHHVFVASCLTCQQQRTAERAAALARVEAGR